METLSKSTETVDLIDALTHALLMLARREDELAATEAASVPYWAACPSSVYGHRAAADALRAEAANLLVA